MSDAPRKPATIAVHAGRPPHESDQPFNTPVTFASTHLESWHGYGLAVDVISRSRNWNQPESWFASVAKIFARHGCRWGGDWKRKDLPHFQWGACKPSPSPEARAMAEAGALQAIWTQLGAHVA